MKGAPTRRQSQARLDQHANGIRLRGWLESVQQRRMESRFQRRQHAEAEAAPEPERPEPVYVHRHWSSGRMEPYIGEKDRRLAGKARIRARRAERRARRQR